MLVYIWFRFEWQCGVGAVIALAHDVILTIGIFSLLGFEFNLSTVAAILTIAGYSINDTVVVYDRVRENLRKFKALDMAELLNRSINETLSRTVMTSATTLLALFALYFFGGEVIQGFVFAMMFGVVVGTYSSVFIAVALLLELKPTRRGGAKAEVEEPPGS
jgi:preprotein translocase SecF subunit